MTMFGTTVVSDWKQGSPISWKGEWKGKPDLPENYHTVTIELAREGEKTAVSLEQDNNATSEAQEHSAQNWTTMLDGMKKLLEA